MANIFPIDFEEKLTMAQDDYILFSDSEDGNKIKKAQYKNLKGEKWDTWATGNWISTITETTSWKVHTITITETDGDTTVFSVSDGADGEWSGDVVWPNWAVDGNVALFDGNTWKLIKDW